MTKPLMNRFYLKQVLYSNKISSEKIIREFNKLILDLENIDIQIDGENQVLLLMCFLYKMYYHFKETLLRK